MNYQKEYLQETQSVDREGSCDIKRDIKRDKTDIEYQLDGLDNNSEQIEALITKLGERLVPVMSSGDVVKICEKVHNTKMEEISPLATHIRNANISLSGAILKMNEILSRLQI
jgi:hypothetical protein